MDTSVLIARFLGPVFLVAALRMLLAPDAIAALARDFLQHTSLMFLSGVLLLVGGIAIVNAHNVWRLDWTLILTLVGWAMAIGGAMRIAVPEMVANLGRSMIGRAIATRIAGAAWAVIGVVLVWAGYF